MNYKLSTACLVIAIIVFIEAIIGRVAFSVDAAIPACIGFMILCAGLILKKKAE